MVNTLVTDATTWSIVIPFQRRHIAASTSRRLRNRQMQHPSQLLGPSGNWPEAPRVS